MTFVSTDILNPYKRNILSTDSYATLIDFLTDKYPNGFERATDISVNGNILEVDDYDYELSDKDIIVLLDRAALPVGLIGGWFITALANLAISIAISYIANKLFAPDEIGDQAAPSTVYNDTSGQNTARYGAPIPIVYGTVRMYPSMIVQPYYRFENNIEYLYHVLCVGQGRHSVPQIMIGDDVITSTDGLQWKLLNKEHFYDIPTNAYGIHLTKTLASPQNLQLKGFFEPSERYTINNNASNVEFDLYYPGGVFKTNDEGEYKSLSTTMSWTLSTLLGGVYTIVNSGVIVTTGSNADPIQKTINIDISGYNENVYIHFIGEIFSNTKWHNEAYIKRVKEIYPNEDFTSRYGDITLLVCKIKATNSISTAGQVKVNGYFTRTDVGNTMAEVLTDIYTNTTYGGGLSAGDLFFPTTIETVNCCYEENITIFDAMRKPALAQGYSLFLSGMDVILKKDAPNHITTAMYNEMNIIQNSLKVQYLFKEEYPSYDGYECTYIDGNGWKPATYKYPATSTRPQSVDLFGVVDFGQWSPCVEYPYGIGYTQVFLDNFTVLSGLYWLIWGNPTPLIQNDAGATDGKVLDTSGDGTYHSGLVLNGHPLPTNKAIRVTFRAAQPLAGTLAWDYVDVCLNTAPGISSVIEGSPGADHARIRIDGGKNNGSTAYTQAIYYESIGNLPEFTYTPVNYDNNASYNEYEIIYSPINENTHCVYILKQNGIVKTCSTYTMPSNSNYYVTIEGRSSTTINKVDWIKVEVES